MRGNLWLVKWYCRNDVSQSALDGALVEAVMGLLDILKYLHQNGASIHAVNAKGATALSKAAAANRLEVVKYLRQNGADIHARDINGNDALLWAAKGEYIDICDTYWIRRQTPISETRKEKLQPRIL